MKKLKLLFVLVFVFHFLLIRFTKAQFLDPQTTKTRPEELLKYIPEEDPLATLYSLYDIPSDWVINNDNFQPPSQDEIKPPKMSKRIKRMAESSTESSSLFEGTINDKEQETTTVQIEEIITTTIPSLPKSYSDDDIKITDTGDPVCDKLLSSTQDIENTTTTGDYSKELLRCLLLEIREVKKAILAPQIKKAEFEGDKYLPKNYNKLEIPVLNISFTAPNGTVIAIVAPLQCQLFLNIRAIRDFDEDKEEITFDMDVILSWTDGNILKTLRADKLKALVNVKPLFLDPSFLDKLWKPDIYIEELTSLSSPTIMGNSKTLLFFPYFGAFVYKSRVIAKCSCEMNFFHYPADTQVCKFNIKSFSYTSERFAFSWNLGNGLPGVYLLEPDDPNFDFQVESKSNSNISFPIGPKDNKLWNKEVKTEYATLQFTVLARRKMSFQIVQTYIPSVFFVIVTWLCFLIPSEHFEARVGIAMTTMLTLTAMFASVRETTPKVSYVKAIDAWMLCCVLFLFAALTAFTGSVWVKHMNKHLAKKNDDIDDIQDGTKGKKTSKLVIVMYGILDRFIEKYLAFLMSTTFIIFIIIYWSWLLIDSGHINWEINKILNAVDD